MRLDDVLQALRDGKSIRRQGWEGFSIRIMGLALYGNNNKPYAFNLCDISAMDWEVVPKPKRVADFLVEITDPNPLYHLPPFTHWLKQTHPVGQQPEGAVMVPGSERET
jgi:hypothetical protein